VLTGHVAAKGKHKTFSFGGKSIESRRWEDMVRTFNNIGID
jgi:hypothetical protein